jgi:hypothetical protein
MSETEFFPGFIEEIEKDEHEKWRDEAIELQKRLWESWGWPGPAVGRYFNISTTCARRVGEENQSYCYSEEAYIESIDEEKREVIAVIDHWPRNWTREEWENGPSSNGQKYIIGFEDISPIFDNGTLVMDPNTYRWKHRMGADGEWKECKYED